MADYNALIRELGARGFEFVPRQNWQDPNNPVSGPSYKPGAVTTSYIHWPGAESLRSDVAAWMLSVDVERRNLDKPYSFPYNFVIRDRKVFEGRGWAFKNAANKGSKVPGNANQWSQSLLIYRAIGEAASPTECEAAAVVSHMAGDLAEFPHAAVEATDCPGVWMRIQLGTGAFDIAAWPSGTTTGGQGTTGTPIRGGATVSAGPTINWSAVDITDRRIAAMQLLIEKYGCSVNGAAGIVGNFEAESSIIPNRVQGSKDDTPMTARDKDGKQVKWTARQIMEWTKDGTGGPRSGGGIGLAQWTEETRREGLFIHSFGGTVLGPDILFSMEAQVDYVNTELTTKSFFSDVNETVRSPTVSIEDASDVILEKYENPAVQDEAQINKRRRMCHEALAAFTTAPGPVAHTEPVEPEEVDEEGEKEDEDIVIAYIAQPPDDDAHKGKPWMVCINGSVRYATSFDLQAGLELRRINVEQYAWLLRSAHLE